MQTTGDTPQHTTQQSAAGPGSSDPAPENAKHDNPVRNLWNAIRNSRLLTKFILLLVVLLLGFIAWRAISTPQWIFNVKARTGIVELVTPSDGETRWRVNGSVICTRGALQPDSEPLSGARLTDKTCGSTAWTGYRFRDPEQTLVLNGSFRVLLEIGRDGSLFLSLRDYKPEGRQDQADAAKQPPQATLTFTDGTPDIALGRNGRTRINFLWSGGLEPEAGQPDDRVFPFSGITTIGRDINWTGTSMLSEGSVQVYTADDSPDKRQQVDEAELLLGDQVRLENTVRDGMLIPPKGFIRFQPDSDAFDVIAFGAADRVRIERYGDNGYNFRPGLVSKLLHDPLFLIVLTAFAGFISLAGTIDAMCSTKECE